MDTVLEMRIRLLKSRIKQKRLAEKLGLTESHLSLVLCGHREMAQDFPQRFEAAIAAIETEDAEAEETPCAA